MKENKAFYLLIFLGVAVFWAFPWFIGNDLPPAHVLAFLLHQNGAWFIPLVILAVVFTIFCVIGRMMEFIPLTRSGFLWSALFILTFAVAAVFGYTRFSAKSDPNIKYRYNAFIEEKGWDK